MFRFPVQSGDIAVCAPVSDPMGPQHRTSGGTATAAASRPAASPDGGPCCLGPGEPPSCLGHGARSLPWPVWIGNEHVLESSLRDAICESLSLSESSRHSLWLLLCPPPIPLSPPRGALRCSLSVVACVLVPNPGSVGQSQRPAAPALPCEGPRLPHWLLSVCWGHLASACGCPVVPAPFAKRRFFPADMAPLLGAGWPLV